MEPRDETPIDVLVEMCVYAPLGFALEARSLLPRFVERGRNQVNMARVVGKFAARKGREGIEGRVEESQAMVLGLLELAGVVSAPSDTAASEDAGGDVVDISRNGSAPGAGRVVAAPGGPGDGGTAAQGGAGDGGSEGAPVADAGSVVTGSGSAGEPVAGSGGQPGSAAASKASDPEAEAVAAPEESSLAIPGYGSLAASQVVPRLASLTSDELDAVRLFESANRGRRTILNRIAQLQSA